MIFLFSIISTKFRGWTIILLREFTNQRKAIFWNGKYQSLSPDIMAFDDFHLLPSISWSSFKTGVYPKLTHFCAHIFSLAANLSISRIPNKLALLKKRNISLENKYFNKIFVNFAFSIKEINISFQKTNLINIFVDQWSIFYIKIKKILSYISEKGPFKMDVNSCPQKPKSFLTNQHNLTLLAKCRRKVCL
jgi:hypothetical protein